MGWLWGKEKTPEEKEPSVLEALGLNKQTLADIGKVVINGESALTVGEESKKAEKENQTESTVEEPVIGMGLNARLALHGEDITPENNPFQARDAARENPNPAWRDNSGMAYTA